MHAQLQTQLPGTCFSFLEPVQRRRTFSTTDVGQGVNSSRTSSVLSRVLGRHAIQENAKPLIRPSSISRLARLGIRSSAVESCPRVRVPSLSLTQAQALWLRIASVDQSTRQHLLHCSDPKRRNHFMSSDRADSKHLSLALECYHLHPTRSWNRCRLATPYKEDVKVVASSSQILHRRRIYRLEFQLVHIIPCGRMPVNPALLTCS